MDARIKAMILSAGFGSRLQPLTNRWAKPLIPFLGTHPLAMAMARVKNLGIKDVAVNAHYNADQVREFVDQNPFNLRLYYSYEKDILGSGGCYNPIREWLGDDHLLVINGDIVANIDLERLIQIHFSGDSLVTLGFLPEVVPGEIGFHAFGDRIIGFGAEGVPGTKARNFTGIQVLSPRFLDRLPRQGTFCIKEKGYIPAIAEEIAMFSLLHQGIWHDIRDPAYYRKAVLDILAKPGEWQSLGISDALKALGVSFVYRPATKDRPAGFAAQEFDLSLVGPNVVIEDNVEMGEGCRISNSVLLPGAKVGDRVQASDSVFFDQVILDAGDPSLRSG